MRDGPGHHVTPVDAADVAAARLRVGGRVRRTPVLTLPAGELGLDGHPVALKLDCLQITGSFKARGALSLLSACDPGHAGVVAASGGNFGAAVAWAARALGCRARIVVPASTPEAKLAAIAGWDAEVIRVEGDYAEAAAAAEELVRRTGAVSAHAYDAPLVVAGQGTLAAEFVEDAELDTVLVAVGGGGLLAGTLAALEARDIGVVAVETTGTPTLVTALEAHAPVDVAVSGIAASALGARRIGAHAWAVRDRLAGSLLVPDAAVEAAMGALWHAARLVVEPGGATALAALLSGAYRPRPGERVGVVVCGANTDPAGVTSVGE